MVTKHHTHLLLAVVLILLQQASSLAGAAEVQGLNASTTSTTSTTTTTTTTTTPPPTKVSPLATTSSTSDRPAIKNESATTTTTAASSPTTSTTSTTTVAPSTRCENIDEMKKTIQKHIDPSQTENRIIVNRPHQAPVMTDFASDSIEARVSDATSQFGLKFMKNIQNADDNVVLSPLSLQNLLNMILLGTNETSGAHGELIKILGYDSTGLLSLTANRSSEADLLRPHEAMKSVFDSIMAATHLSVASPSQADTELLNTNTGSLVSPQLTAHLQTSLREDEIPLSGQLNFTMANLVLTNDDLVKLRADYEKDLKNYYDVSLERFSPAERRHPAPGSPLPLFERVNSWVRNKTQNMIERLAEPGDLSDPNLMMVLLNAAHFKGRWLHTFNTWATYEGTFWNQGKEAIQTNFMRQVGVFGYADFGISERAFGPEGLMRSEVKASAHDAETVLTEDAATAANRASETSQPGASEQPASEETRRQELLSSLNCRVLMMPFSLNEGQELSMILLLPARRDGIKSLQDSLTGPVLNDIYRSLSEQQVQLQVPKFSFDSSHDARDTLIRMGLREIFRDSAHFSRMFEGPNVQAHVDKVVHKAKISVDESGAEAAATSMGAVAMRNLIRPPRPEFIAEHPFLFVIRHNRSNMPLFMGRVNKLQESP